jgi:hypothetical protein
MNWIKRVRSLWNVENIKIVRRIIVSVVGATVLLIGIALLVLPGPAFIVIPIGLAILATEYAWARHWLKKVRQIASGVVSGRGASNQNRQTQDPVRNGEAHRAEQDWDCAADRQYQSSRLNPHGHRTSDRRSSEISFDRASGTRG